MKALPMQQPWASLVALGIKSTETRDRHTKHRGPLLICATQTLVPYDQAQVAWDTLLDVTGIGPDLDVQRGKVIGGVIVGGSVRSMDVCWRADVEGWQLNGSMPSVHPDQRPLGDFGSGRRVWLLGAAVSFDEPIPCRGMPGMFNAPADVEEQAVAQWTDLARWSRSWV